MESVTTPAYLSILSYSLLSCSIVILSICAWRLKYMTFSGPAYKLEAIPGSGSGMVAARFIPRGSLIISESPLFTVHGDFTTLGKTAAAIEAKVSTLSAEQKTIFLSLHNSQGSNMSTVVGIVKTNAHPLGVGARDCGIFPVCSRFNHSCASNASYTWVAASGKETIYAGKDIVVGEQITVNYLDESRLNQKRSDRRAALMQDFRFECNCNVCGASPREVAASDRRRREIARLDGIIGGGMIVITNPPRCLEHCKDILRLYMEEGMNDDSLFKTYNDAFQVCIMHGDLARASTFATLAVSCLGAGDPTIDQVRPYIEHPERHQYAGMSNKWRTEKRLARKVGQNGFEKWLWERAG